MEEFLTYFRKAIEMPGSVPAWAVWWAANEEKLRHAFAHMDYVRLKHRKLVGAAVILEQHGWKPPPRPPDPLRTGFCHVCGETVIHQPAGPGGGSIFCPNRCFECVYDCRVEPGFWERFRKE